MKKKLFFLVAILSLGFLTACNDDNEYMLDDSSKVTPTIEIAQEDVIIQSNNGSTIQLKATVANPSGIASVTIISSGLGLEETIEVNAPTYSLNKEFTIPTGTQEGVYLVSITANSKNLLTITKEIKVLVGNVSDNIAPVLTLLTDTEEQFKSSVEFRLRVADNLGLKSIRVWSEDEESINDVLDLDGIAEYEYYNVFTLPANYSGKSLVIKAEATDLFGNKTEMDPATFKVNVLPEKLYLIGDATEAGWEPADAIEFNNTGEGKFELVATLLSDGYGFKFIGATDWTHGVWGFETAVSELLIDGYTGVLYESASSENIPPVAEAGLYKIIVDIENLTFSIHKITYPDQLFLVGGSTPADWDEFNPLPFEKLELGKFRIFSYLTKDGYGLKLLVEKGTWDGAWGMKKDEEGTLITGSEENITVAEDGFYALEVDFDTMTYELIKMQFGIIGGFNEWGGITPMNFDPVKGNYSFTITQAFDSTGDFKFKWDRENWDYNFGAPTAAGELSGVAVFGGENIKITEVGTYDIVLDLDPDGYTYSVTKK